jgi:hypothetical protein
MREWLGQEFPMRRAYAVGLCLLLASGWLSQIVRELGGLAVLGGVSLLVWSWRVDVAIRRRDKTP